MQTSITEASRSVSVVDDCDVLVAGGGPAGVAAAITAARLGASVRLVEVHGCLGGIWTAGALSWVLDATNKNGFVRGLLDELDRRGARAPLEWSAYACDPEAMKLLEEWCAQSGVRVRLHTRVAAAISHDGRLRYALTESKSGREAFAARIFIDATGDGDLAAQAGCGFWLGHPDTGRMQPMSLIAVLGGVEYEQIKPYVHARVGDDPYRADSRRLLELLRQQECEPSYHGIILMRVYDNLFLMMGNHEYGVSGLDAQQITDATVRARAEVNRIVAALRSSGGPWANLRLVATAEQIGVREGRRIHGHYCVSDEDLVQGSRHRDAVCRVLFPVDVHSTDPTRSKGNDRIAVKARPYDIPLRALIARDVKGLLMAGRCISGDFIAHSSYRVTGNAAALGEAAGAAAALAARASCLPEELPWERLAEVLPPVDDPSRAVSFP